tara:strand:+ start:2978 stop:3370 length:393 start_codon:yes stop_codon:yes gene_type:complete
MSKIPETNSKVRARAYVKVINEVAINFYDFGWDGWVETLDPDEKMSIIAGAKTVREAVVIAQDWVVNYTESEAIGAENSALYDTGDESADKRYQHYIQNYKSNLYMKEFQRTLSGLLPYDHLVFEKETEG